MNDKEKVGFYGETFQQKSKNFRNVDRSSTSTDIKKMELYKTYQNVSKVSLPKPEFSNEIKFWDVIKKRRSARTFSSEPISLMDLSQLLYGITGLTRIFPKFAFRTIPSAGGLFPIETYSIINNVEDLKQGIYHYNISEHSLECLREGDFRKIASNTCYGQRMVSKSAVNFFWTAFINRTKIRYGERSYRYIYLDCGHIGQNFYLVAEGLSLNACVVGAFIDDEVNELLDLNEKEEFVIYIGVVGKKRNK